MMQIENCISFFNKLILDKIRENNEYNEGLVVFIAGGCMRDYFQGELSSKTDIDLFFTKDEDVEYVNTLFEKTLKAKKVYQSDNSTRWRYKGRIFDVVHKYFKPDMNSLIESFDFTITKCATDGKSVVYHDTFFMDLAKKQLVFTDSQLPANVIWRMAKYLMKGYKICVGECQKVADCFADSIEKDAKSDSSNEGSSSENEEYDSKEKRSVRFTID